MESKIRLHLNSLSSYHPQQKEWSGSLIPREMVTFKRHNFGNTFSLLRVKINRWLIKGLISTWDITDRVFRFSAIELCLTIKKYSRILGVPHNKGFIVFPSFNQGFRSWMSKISGSRRISGTKEARPMNVLWTYFAIYLPNEVYLRTIEHVQLLVSRLEPQSNPRLRTCHPWPYHVF